MSSSRKCNPLRATLYYKFIAWLSSTVPQSHNTTSRKPVRAKGMSSHPSFPLPRPMDSSIYFFFHLCTRSWCGMMKYPADDGSLSSASGPKRARPGIAHNHSHKTKRLTRRRRAIGVLSPILYVGDAVCTSSSDLDLPSPSAASELEATMF